MSLGYLLEPFGQYLSRLMAFLRRNLGKLLSHPVKKLSFGPGWAGTSGQISAFHAAIGRAGGFYRRPAADTPSPDTYRHDPFQQPCYEKRGRALFSFLP